MEVLSDFKMRLDAYRERVEQALDAQLPPAQTRPTSVHQAMRYSVMAGGKRLRPVLLLAAADVFGGRLDPMPAAVAVECLHTYSLIHDDLPCMDNSDLRRGRPTCHKQFPENIALLAGDALLTWALWHLAESYREAPEVAVDLVRTLGDASGSEKLIGGQVEDLEGELETPTAERLIFIHENKTAALITACLTMGARVSGADAAAVKSFTEVGRHLGLAFQIIDDILDVTSTAEAMGKPVGADVDNHKMTYPALYGLEASRQKALEHTQEAVRLCESVEGDAAFLVELIHHMEKRVN